MRDTNTHAQVPRLEFVSRTAHSRALIYHTHQHRPGTRPQQHRGKKKEVCLVRGPGTIYVSSLPMSKQACRLLNATPPKLSLFSYVQWFLCAWGCLLVVAVLQGFYKDIIRGR